MKKNGLLFLLLAFSAISVSAQLENTKWKNSMNIPDPVATSFQFKKDTAFLYTAEDDILIETITYSIRDGVLKMIKVTGGSPCSTEVGSYKIEFKDEKLFLTPIEDACSERSAAFPTSGWVKEK